MYEKLPEDEVFHIVEQMPLFCAEECDHLEDPEERKRCSKNAQLGFIYRHAAYPVEAFNKGREGTAVVSFVVEQDGTISDIQVVDDPGDGLGDAALSLVKKMQTEDVRWVPGRQKGQAVRVRINMPIQFELEKKA